MNTVQLALQRHLSPVAAVVVVACGTTTQIPDERVTTEGEGGRDGTAKPYSMGCPSGQASDLHDGAEVLEMVSRGCVAFKNGAWAYRLDAWGTPEGEIDATLVGTFLLTFRGPDRAIEGPTFEIAAGRTRSTVDPPFIHDFDGDGTPEVFVRVSMRVPDDAPREQAGLYRKKGDAIEPYPGLPQHPIALFDQDEDGSPDVLYLPYATPIVDPCTRKTRLFRGPTLLAHALDDGTFSLDDDVAKAFAKKSCAKSKDEGFSELCARITGARADEALTVLKRSCPPLKPGADACAARDKKQCIDHGARSELVAREPPVVLR